MYDNGSASTIDHDTDRRSVAVALDATELTHAERSELTDALLRAAHDTEDPAERDELLERVVLMNRRVAQAVARRYRRRGVPDEDLEQAAYEGLTKAVQKFDPRLRNDLLTYAVPTIRGEVQRYFRDQSWTVRPPRRLQELQRKVNHAIEELGAELGREPEEVEVQARLRIGPEEYRETMASFGCFQPPSLDQPLKSAPEFTLGDALAAPSTGHEAVEARILIAQAVRDLPERDRRILYLRFFEDRTQQEIGDELGVTQMHVSRLLSRILERLRRELD
jgi:RNA polymerase sigma-B factor